MKWGYKLLKRSYDGKYLSPTATYDKWQVEYHLGKPTMSNQLDCGLFVYSELEAGLEQFHPKTSYCNELWLVQYEPTPMLPSVRTVYPFDFRAYWQAVFNQDFEPLKKLYVVPLEPYTVGAHLVVLVKRVLWYDLFESDSWLFDNTRPSTFDFGRVQKVTSIRATGSSAV